MKLERSAVSFDLETTDSDPATAAIFEYGAVLLRPDGSRVEFSKRFKPWKPITPGAIEVTGVTNEMVENCPPFAQYAKRIWKSLQGKDLIGYNLRRFDICCLDEEIRRATKGNLRLDLAEIRVIDAQVIYFKQDGRTLSDAVRKYCGREHDGAHGAQADAIASIDVLRGQLEMYPDLDKMTIDELAKFSIQGDNEPVDLAGKLYRDKDGDVAYAFGKQKDRKVRDAPDYADWMLRSSFPGSTCDALRAELERLWPAG